MAGRIVAIFGKKGSGKSTLSKYYMSKWGGRVVFLSPVESLTIDHDEAWEFDDIEYQMTDMRPGDVLLIRRADVAAMDFVGARALAEGSGYTILVDEVDKFKESKQLIDVVHYARHAQIDLIVNTRRYADMKRLITSQADELCFFRTHEPADIDYAKKIMGKEYCEMLPELKPYYYLHYVDGSIEVKKTIDLGI